MASGLPGTHPTSFGRDAKKQLLVRVEREAADELYGMLRAEGLTLQKFLELCVVRYVASDPHMRAIIEAYRRNEQVSAQEKDGGEVFSEKEKRELLKAIGKREI